MMRKSSSVALLALLALLALQSACASGGATFRSGVGDRFLEHPPYYAGDRPAGVTRVVYLPVHFQRGSSQASIFDPSSTAGSPVASLVREINAALDSLAASGGLTKLTRSPTGLAPNVSFGCAQDATGDCEQRGDSVLGRRGTTMRLALERPSAEWIAAARQRMDSAGATHALLVTLEIGQYWPRQTGLRGDKSVELGTGYTVPLRWLTSLETPVTVLQLTGVLIDRDGRGTRIGAEGILARRTPLIASGVGAQRLITDEDIEQARTLRRVDLPGEPLAWKVALGQLVSSMK